MAGGKRTGQESGGGARGRGAGGPARDDARPREQGPSAAAEEAAGLDAEKHAASQRAARQAELMREALFPALMADALGYDGTFDSRSYKVYLERLMDDAGNPADPIERMMLEQLALSHFRIGQLQVSAGKAQGTEATKVYNSAASRLLGEFRRTALALRAYRTRVPEGVPAKTLKLFKAAE